MWATSKSCSIRYSIRIAAEATRHRHVHGARRRSRAGWPRSRRASRERRRHRARDQGARRRPSSTDQGRHVVLEEPLVLVVADDHGDVGLDARARCSTARRARAGRPRPARDRGSDPRNLRAQPRARWSAAPSWYDITRPCGGKRELAGCARRSWRTTATSSAGGVSMGVCEVARPRTISAMVASLARAAERASTPGSVRPIARR